MPRNEWFGPIGRRVIQTRPVLTGDLDQILESGIGDQGDIGAGPLQQCVRGRCGSVEKLHHIDPADGAHNRIGLITGRRNLTTGDAYLVDNHHVGEGPTDIDTDDCGHGYPLISMTVRVEQTPNPNAKKFAVGQPVGGPGTFVKGAAPGEVYLSDLLALDGVASVFFTADFVTISKTPDGTWETITPEATAILESHFGD